MLDKVENIDEDVNILLTHWYYKLYFNDSPPKGIMDLVDGNYKKEDVCKLCKGNHHASFHWGKSKLYEKIKSIKPLAHLFGHVHDQPGFLVENDILYCNAAMDFYKTPILFDVIIKN
jgi:Icc-related predicted phosphoesterase